MSIYDFTIKDAHGADVALSTYKNNVLLVVNTATECGFTPQYNGLQKLYAKYVDKGFEVLDFPCNQFGGQAPGTSEEIVAQCQLVHGITFKTFAKIEVNGAGAEPLFTFLKDSVPAEKGKDINWNFTKFLVASDGTVLKRYEPPITPEDIESDIIKALG